MNCISNNIAEASHNIEVIDLTEYKSADDNVANDSEHISNNIAEACLDIEFVDVTHFKSTDDIVANDTDCRISNIVDGSLDNKLVDITPCKSVVDNTSNDADCISNYNGIGKNSKVRFNGVEINSMIKFDENFPDCTQDSTLGINSNTSKCDLQYVTEIFTDTSNTAKCDLQNVTEILTDTSNIAKCDLQTGTETLTDTSQKIQKAVDLILSGKQGIENKNMNGIRYQIIEVLDVIFHEEIVLTARRVVKMFKSSKSYCSLLNRSSIQDESKIDDVSMEERTSMAANEVVGETLIYIDAYKFYDVDVTDLLPCINNLKKKYTAEIMATFHNSERNENAAFQNSARENCSDESSQSFAEPELHKSPSTLQNTMNGNHCVDSGSSEINSEKQMVSGTAESSEKNNKNDLLPKMSSFHSGESSLQAAINKILLGSMLTFEACQMYNLPSITVYYELKRIRQKESLDQAKAMVISGKMSLDEAAICFKVLRTDLAGVKKDKLKRKRTRGPKFQSYIDTKNILKKGRTKLNKANENCSYIVTKEIKLLKQRNLFKRLNINTSDYVSRRQLDAAKLQNTQLYKELLSVRQYQQQMLLLRKMKKTGIKPEKKNHRDEITRAKKTHLKNNYSEKEIHQKQLKSSTFQQTNEEQLQQDHIITKQALQDVNAEQHNQIITKQALQDVNAEQQDHIITKQALQDVSTEQQHHIITKQALQNVNAEQQHHIITKQALQNVNAEKQHHIITKQALQNVNAEKQHHIITKQALQNVNAEQQQDHMHSMNKQPILQFYLSQHSQNFSKWMNYYYVIV